MIVCKVRRIKLSSLERRKLKMTSLIGFCCSLLSKLVMKVPKWSRGETPTTSSEFITPVNTLNPTAYDIFFNSNQNFLSSSS